jgi:hypothetical protein
MDTSSDQIFARIFNPSGQGHADVSGGPEAMARLFTSLWGNPQTPTLDNKHTDQLQIEQKETPASVQDAGASEVTVEHPKEDVNLISFYRKTSPKGQPEIMAVIAYHHIRICGRETITQADFEAAFRELKRLPVTTPKDIHTTIRNTIVRKDWLYSEQHGQYNITLACEEYVEGLLKK